MKAIYPGTFDPFSLGHLDVVIKSLDIFDHVVVAAAENRQKDPSFSVDDRVEMIKLCVGHLPKVEVVGFSGLLVEYMKNNNIRHAIRGIRGMVDFEYEFQLAQINRFIFKEYEPVFIMPDEKLMVLSSSIIREIAGYGGDISKYIPEAVAEYIKGLPESRIGYWRK